MAKRDNEDPAVEKLGILDRRRVLSPEKFEKPKPFGERIRKIRIALNVAIFFSILLVVALCLCPIEEIYTAKGVVRPKDYLRVYAPANLQQTKEPLVNEGQWVQKGQPLMQFELPDREREIMEAEESLDSLKAQLEIKQARTQALREIPENKELWELQDQLEQTRKHRDYFKTQLERLLELQKSGVVSDQEIDRARLEYESAKIEADRFLQRVEKNYSQPEIEVSRTEERNLERRIQGMERKLQFLREQKEELALVRAPSDGIILDLPQKNVIGLIPEGRELVYMAIGSEKVAVILGQQRNVDQVQVGQSVRLRSEVFDHLKYGYARGKVVKKSLTRESAVGPEAEVGEAYYTIVAEIEELPHGPDGEPKQLAMDSTILAQIILRRAPLFKVLFLN